jgi:hypothetical protein
MYLFGAFMEKKWVAGIVAVVLIGAFLLIPGEEPPAVPPEMGEVESEGEPIARTGYVGDPEYGNVDTSESFTLQLNETKVTSIELVLTWTDDEPGTPQDTLELSVNGSNGSADSVRGNTGELIIQFPETGKAMNGLDAEWNVVVSCIDSGSSIRWEGRILIIGDLDPGNSYGLQVRYKYAEVPGEEKELDPGASVLGETYGREGAYDPDEAAVGQKSF